MPSPRSGVEDEGDAISHAPRSNKIPRPAALAWLAELVRPAWVFPNGVFDILPPGQCHLSRPGARHGSEPRVALNGDASARRLAGRDRPLNALADRLAVVAALACLECSDLVDDDNAGEADRSVALPTSS